MQARFEHRQVIDQQRTMGFEHLSVSDAEQPTDVRILSFVQVEQLVTSRNGENRAILRRVAADSVIRRLDLRAGAPGRRASGASVAPSR
jgi:hypothetical protein